MLCYPSSLCELYSYTHEYNDVIKEDVLLSKYNLFDAVEKMLANYMKPVMKIHSDIQTNMKGKCLEKTTRNTLNDLRLLFVNENLKPAVNNIYYEQIEVSYLFVNSIPSLKIVLLSKRRRHSEKCTSF